MNLPSAFRRAGAILSAARTATFNVLFVLVVLAVLASVVGAMVARNPTLPPGSVLLVAPNGPIVEAPPSPDPIDLVRRGDEPPPTEQIDLIRALRAAATDPRIQAVVIKPADMGPGLARIEEASAAIAAIRRAGKPVLAWGDRLDQVQYLLASNANQIYLDPDGVVGISGLARRQLYFRTLLEQLGVKINVFKVGTYKSAVEPFLRDSMSPADREAAEYYLGDLWQQLVQAVASHRKIAPDGIVDYAQHGAERLREAGGDSAKMAVRAHLVDILATRQEFDDLIAKRFGAREDGRGPRYVSVTDYASVLAAADRSVPDRIAMVVVDGVITDGASRAGVAGSRTIVRTIEDAVRDKRVRALVVRVNSPGGSATASEDIRRALQRARDAGKPVVVSMSTLAASGGYWISMASDRIYANASTITGSIGIFGVQPELAKPLEKLGIHADGVATAPDAGQPDLVGPLSPGMADRIDQQIRFGYERFIATVAKGRKLEPDQVETVAQGRVWTGAQALSRHLVDKIGGLEDAIAAAGELAKAQRFVAVYAEPERSPRARLIAALLGARAQAGGSNLAALPMLDDALNLAELVRDSGHGLAYCGCEFE